MNDQLINRIQFNILFRQKSAETLSLFLSWRVRRSLRVRIRAELSPTSRSSISAACRAPRTNSWTAPSGTDGAVGTIMDISVMISVGRFVFVTKEAGPVVAPNETDREALSEVVF